MTSFEPSKAYIDQASFVASADELLAQSDNPDVELRTAVESAQQVLTQLGNIASEKLVVQPPLSEEQIEGYTKTATTIVGIGQKALGSLESSSTQREATQEGTTVKGKGDEAKSTTHDKPSGDDPTPPQPRRRGRPRKNS